MIGTGSRIEEKIYGPDGTLIRKIKYMQLDFLGKGGFAKVFKLQKSESSNNDINHFAAKIIDKSILARKNNQVKMAMEIQIHNQMRHKHIAQLYNTFEDEQNVLMIMELCSNGTLQHMLRKRGSLTEVEVKFYIL